MVPLIAFTLFTVGIAWLFWLDETPKGKMASWLPTMWVLIGGSRNVGEWLNVGVRMDATSSHVEGNAIDRYALAILLFLSFVVLVQRRQRVSEFFRANIAVVLFFAYCLVSLVWSDVPFIGLRRWCRMMGDIMMVLVILTDADPALMLRIVLKRAAFLAIPLSVLLIRYFPDMGRAYGADGSLYWTGVSTGKNGLGITCFIFGFATVWRLVSAYRDRQLPNRRNILIAHGTVAVIGMYLLQVANSMTSLMCFSISTILFLVMTKRRRKAAPSMFAQPSPATQSSGLVPVMLARNSVLVHTVVIASMVVAGSVLFLGAGGSALEAMGRDPTLTGRTIIWEIALGFVRNPWFGEGYESFWTPQRIAAMASRHAGLTQAHNGYIEVYLNLGLVGVGFLVIMIVAGYRKSARLLRVDPEIGSLRLVFLVVALIYNCTEGAFKFMTPVWFCFLLGAIGTPAAAPTRESVKTPARTTPRFVRAGREWRSA